MTANNVIWRGFGTIDANWELHSDVVRADFGQYYGKVPLEERGVGPAHLAIGDRVVIEDHTSYVTVEKLKGYKGNMDPNATFKEFCRALLEENANSAREFYDYLRTWLERGGFEPDWSPQARKQFFQFNPSTGRLE